MDVRQSAESSSDVTRGGRTETEDNGGDRISETTGSQSGEGGEITPGRDRGDSSGLPGTIRGDGGRPGQGNTGDNTGDVRQDGGRDNRLNA